MCSLIVRNKVGLLLEPEQPSQKLPNGSIFKRFLQLFRSPSSSTKNPATKQAAPTSLHQDSDMVENPPAYVETGILPGSENQPGIGLFP